MILPFLIADALVKGAAQGPVKSGIAFVSGELGRPTGDIIAALRRTVEWPIREDREDGECAEFSTGGWWEAVFALEKLHYFSEPQELQGEAPIEYLIQHIPPGYETPEAAREKFLSELSRTDLP